MVKYKYASLSELKETRNSHQSGWKRVFLSSQEVGTSITQIAHASFQPGESSGLHVHQTMDEVFFFTEGKGYCVLDGEKIEVGDDSILYIPAGCEHDIGVEADAETQLTFFYFGVATE